MNNVKDTLQILKEDYTYKELSKGLLTGLIFFVFPVLLVVGLLIVFGTIYPYWNLEFLLGGSLFVFLYGIWTNKLVLETLMQYHEHTYKDLSLLAYGMQFLLFLAIILVDVLIITTIF
jgi:hypothetical protein